MPTLFLEFHGNELGLKRDIEFAQVLAQEENCLEFFFESDSLERARLWEARHNLAYAFIHGFPGKKMMLTDVGVPLTELTGAVEKARELIDASGLDGAVLGHIGDGNYHTLVVIDPNDPEELERAEMVNKEIVEYALNRGGTCTGEHGVGVGKRKYQNKEHGEAVQVMKQMKQMFDPLNILNPGKVLPE